MNKDLFPTPYDLTSPPSAPGSATSKAAAEKFNPIAGKVTRKVLECWAEWCVDGATRDEISEKYDVPIQTVCSRANRLLAIGALEVLDNRLRNTRSGYPAEVLRITKNGAAMLLSSQGE